VDERFPTCFLVKAGQGAIRHGPQGKQHLPMRCPDVAARPAGVILAQKRFWRVEDDINDPTQVLA
jgi:hypothetical protein